MRRCFKKIDLMEINTMKRFLLAILLYSACPSFAQSSAVPSISQLEWLAGEWIRLDPPPGKRGSEKWEIVSPAEMKGTGVTMKGSDTAFVEKLMLVAKDSAVFYVADIAENGRPVFFRLTLIQAEEFVAENPRHDFPKKIRYRKEGNRLKATISGNGKSIYYFFEKR
jgi:hypothetical protein